MLAWAMELLLNEPSVMMGLAVAALAWLFYVIHCHSQMLARDGVAERDGRVEASGQGARGKAV
jgi:hypothetical protein